jgi:hypothetical protein
LTARRTGNLISGDIKEPERRILSQRRIAHQYGPIAVDGDVAGDDRQSVGSKGIVVGRGEVVDARRQVNDIAVCAVAVGGFDVGDQALHVSGAEVGRGRDEPVL